MKRALLTLALLCCGAPPSSEQDAGPRVRAPNHQICWCWWVNGRDYLPNDARFNALCDDTLDSASVDTCFPNCDGDKCCVKRECAPK